MKGVVREFDEAAGLGVVDGEDGSAYRFHCVEIADGSRRIDAGATVRFRTLAKLGQIEAAHLVQ